MGEEEREEGQGRGGARHRGGRGITSPGSLLRGKVGLPAVLSAATSSVQHPRTSACRDLRWRALHAHLLRSQNSPAPHSPLLASATTSASSTRATTSGPVQSVSSRRRPFELRNLNPPPPNPPPPNPPPYPPPPNPPRAGPPIPVMVTLSITGQHSRGHSEKSSHGGLRGRSLRWDTDKCLQGERIMGQSSLCTAYQLQGKAIQRNALKAFEHLTARDEKNRCKAELAVR
eukprot:753378-Hanusia_phi.AAC.3